MAKCDHIPSEFDYLKSEKGKLKWTGDLQVLQSFVKDVFYLQGNWLSPGGDCKAFQNSDLMMRWYTSSTNLTFTRAEAENIQAKVLSLVKLD